MRIRPIVPPAALALALAAGPGSAAADYRGPGATPADSTVALVLANSKDDAEVVLRGTLLRKVDREHYVFGDGTGEIRVEIDKDDFPSQVVDDKTRVQIAGQVDKDFMKDKEIDVRTVHVLPQP
jgi:uncharacterized protein (TIGR00156 family)